METTKKKRKRIEFFVGKKRENLYQIILSRIESLCQSLILNKEIINESLQKITFFRIKDYLEILKKGVPDDKYHSENSPTLKKLEEIRNLFSQKPKFKNVIQVITEAILTYQYETYVVIIECDHYSVSCSGEQEDPNIIFSQNVEKEERINIYETYSHSRVSWYKVRVGDVIVVSKDAVSNPFFQNGQKTVTAYTVRINDIFNLPQEVPDIDCNNGKINEWEDALARYCDSEILENSEISKR